MLDQSLLQLRRQPWALPAVLSAVAATSFRVGRLFAFDCPQGWGVSAHRSPTRAHPHNMLTLALVQVVGAHIQCGVVSCGTSLPPLICLVAFRQRGDSVLLLSGSAGFLCVCVQTFVSQVVCFALDFVTRSCASARVAIYSNFGLRIHDVAFI